MQRTKATEPKAPSLPKAAGVIFGLFPVALGVTVLCSLWLPGGFGAPPLVFRVFGGLIGLFVISFGLLMLYGVLKSPASSASARDHTDSATPAAYECSNCGAPLAASAEVSPHGDAKCPHCGSWFNIHRQ
jgi:DNA-directed RNA polymerase subunit RPC12/RpoP